MNVKILFTHSLLQVLFRLGGGSSPKFGWRNSTCPIVIVQYLWTIDGSNNRRRIIGDSCTGGGVVLLVAVDVRLCVCLCVCLLQLFVTLWWWRMLMDSDGFWWILMDSDGFWWILMDPNGFWWILMNSNGFWWILVNSDGFWWILMDLDGLMDFESGLSACLSKAYDGF